MAGNKSKLTPERHERIVAAIRAGNTREAAAACGGITDRCLYYWLAKGAKGRDADSPCVQLFQAVKNAENDAEIECVAVIRDAMRKQWTAAAWWLERRRPDKWGRKESLDVTFKREAERIAKEMGMPVEAVVAEAERIVQGK